MRFRTALTLASFFMLCFTIAVWSAPISAQDTPKKTPAAGTKSVSGKIASVGDAEFSLEVSGNQKQGMIRFYVDGSTKVEGKLSIGAEATVDYHMDGGNNIATRVAVKPVAGVGSR
jgi:hypothetical protein